MPPSLLLRIRSFILSYLCGAAEGCPSPGTALSGKEWPPPGSRPLPPQSNPYPMKDMVQRPNPFTSIQEDAEDHPSCRVPMGRPSANVLPSPPPLLIPLSLTNLHLRAVSLGTQPKTDLEVTFTFPKPSPDPQGRRPEVSPFYNR